MKYTVFVGDAEEPHEIFEIGNDLLRYDARTWEEAIELFRQSLDQGYTCIMCKEA